MTEQCFWCSKKSPDLKPIELLYRGKTQEVKVCGIMCEKELLAFTDYAESHIKHYIVGLSISIIIGFIVTILRIKIDYGALGVFIIFSGSGLVLLKYPFVTPKTIDSFGAKKAIKSGRILGLVSISLGIIFWIVLAKLIN